MPRNSARHKTDGSDCLETAHIGYHLESIKNKINAYAIAEVKLNDKSLTKKAVYTEVLLKFLANPKNDWPTRSFLSIQVCGLNNARSIYQIFNSDELHAIEQEALQMRRKRYAPDLSRVDRAMFNKAIAGDTAAARIVYERFEGAIDQKVTVNHTAEEFLASLLSEFNSRAALTLQGNTSQIVEIPYDKSKND